MKAGFLVPLGLFAALVVVLAVGINHSRQVGVLQSPLVGHQIPDWELPILTDPAKTLGSRELQGQWYVLNYWGTWCYACRAEHATLLQAQRDARVQIIGVDWKADNPDEDSDAAFTTVYGLMPPTLHVTANSGSINLIGSLTLFPAPNATS